MKLKLLLSGLLLSASGLSPLLAQDYEHLTVTTGFNHDVIANGVGNASASSTVGVDNANYAFMSTDFQVTASSTPPSYALPLTGVIVSTPTAGLTFQLADYSQNNVLRIGGSESGSPITGTVAFSNQVSAKKIFLLATSGSGTSTLTTVVHFTDNTTQTFTGTTVPDWYNSTAQPVAASGFGRVSRGDNGIQNPSGNPRMYQITLNIDTANQPKMIESIEFTKSSVVEGAINIFAITADLLGTCPAPGNLTATAGVDDGSVSWEAAIITPADGYDYYVSTTSDAPTAVTEPTGNVDNATTSVSFEDLVIGQTYYVWVRSHCSDTDQGPWVMASFTTGQMSATYTEGDIETLFASSPNANSATSCPGTLVVSVPDGYQVSATATTYTMTTASNGYKSEQRTKLHCVNTNLGETSLYSGTGNGGSQDYSRSGLTIANGATGDVTFEMRAWRTYGGSGCNTTWNKVDNNSWTVTVTYECVTPATPAAEAEQAVCPGATVANLVAETSYENAELRWYDSETGGEPLEASAVLTEGTYFVSQHRYTCESERQAVTVTLSELLAPTAVAQTVCAGTIIDELVAEGSEGVTYNWYATVDAPEALAANALVETGSYFVSQELNGCESDRTEVAVTLNVISLPVATEQTVCNDTTVDELVADSLEGAELHWYAGADSPQELSEETEVETGSYFVSQSLDGCESLRVEVAVTVNVVPEPTAEDGQEFCAGSTAAMLEAVATEGSELVWYTTEEGDDTIGEDTVLETGIYYVSQMADGCESGRIAVDVVINAVPDAPTGETMQVYEAGETLADLEVTFADGATVTWYVMNNEMELVAVDATTVLEDGETYYVTQTSGTCESEPFAVTVADAAGVAGFNKANLKVYPNPATTILNINYSDVISKVEVMNMLGQKVLSSSVEAATAQLDIASLNAGTYIVNIFSAEGSVTSVKVLKQ